jgi:ClpP class serine protease
MTRQLDAPERALLDAQSRNFYTRFLEVVAQGRGFSIERAAELAQGRVWSGRDAQREGLVDVLGGYEQALVELRGLLGAGAARVDWNQPLVLRPQGESGGLWGRVSLLASLVAEDSPPHPELALAELSVRQGPLLAYALAAQDWL